MEPYADRTPDELIVRDLLAIDRTELANERTLLAYARTALALGITGASSLHFLDGPLAAVTGYGAITVAIATSILGAYRYARLQRLISRIRHGNTR